MNEEKVIVFIFGFIIVTILIFASLGVQFIFFNYDHKDYPMMKVNERDIHVYDDHYCVDVGREIKYATYADTESMEPTFGYLNHGIEIVPKSINEIHVGDIISYYKDGELLVHRVKSIDGDTIIVRGDNAPSISLDTIKFKDVNGVLISIIY
jgi:hypothetical protein